MKPFLLLCCLLFLNLAEVKAQPDMPLVAKVTIFYDQNWDVTVKQEASFFRVAALDTVALKFAGAVTDYYGTGVPFRQVSYGVTGKDGSLQVFYANRKLESQGFFLNDRPAGNWKFYYPDGKPKQTVQYLNQSDFRVIDFFDSTGQQLVKNGTGNWFAQKVTQIGYATLNLRLQGQWKDSLKTDLWTATQADGRKVYEETFEKGHFQNGQIYDVSGQRIIRRYANQEMDKSPFPNSLERAEQLEISSIFGSKGRAMQYILRKEHLLPIDTSRYAYKNDEKMPEYPGGQEAMFRHISQSFKIPPDAAKTGLQGTVVISLVVGVDGAADNFKIIKSLHPSIDREALRVVKGMRKWKPGTVNGVPAPVTYVIPYRISLR